MTNARRMLRARGWAWPAGFAALGVSALLAALAPRWAAEASEAREEARTLRAALAGAERSRREEGAAPRFDAALWPGPAQAADRVTDMLERALRQGVVVQSTQQRIDAIPEAPAQLIRLQQSAQGSYPDLRRHIANALAEDAALGLDRVRLQRNGPVDAAFEADLQWVLLQRAAADPR